MSSIETFNQKMKVNRPPRLEIKTKNPGDAKLAPSSNENTPIDMNKMKGLAPKWPNVAKNGANGYGLSSLTLTISQ